MGWICVARRADSVATDTAITANVGKSTALQFTKDRGERLERVAELQVDLRALAAPGEVEPKQRGPGCFEASTDP